MESLISIFHIDLKLFIAQLINFAIVFSVLYFLIFKPLLKTMTDRSKTIEKSLEDAEAIEKRLALTEKEREEIIFAAKKQASVLMEEANLRGEDRKTELVNKAKEEISKVISQEKEMIARDKEVALKELKTEVAGLVMMTVEKVLNEKMTGEKDKDLIKKMVA